MSGVTCLPTTLLGSRALKNVVDEKLLDDEGGDLRLVKTDRRTDLKFLMSLIKTLSESRSNCIKGESLRQLEATWGDFLDFLAGEGVLFRNISGEPCLKSIVPLALKAIELGGDPFVISRYLSWRDFENLVTEHLVRAEYLVIKNLRFTRRRYEIDVIGLDEVTGRALAIDCKHWAPGYRKSGKLRIFASEHRSKVELLAGRECSYALISYPRLRKVKFYVPVLVTLTESLRGFINGSFVVPIRYFRNFVEDLHYYVDLFGGESLVKNECYDS